MIRLFTLISFGFFLSAAPEILAQTSKGPRKAKNSGKAPAVKVTPGAARLVPVPAPVRPAPPASKVAPDPVVFPALTHQIPGSEPNVAEEKEKRALKPSPNFRFDSKTGDVLANSVETGEHQVFTTPLIVVPVAGDNEVHARAFKQAVQILESELYGVKARAIYDINQKQVIALALNTPANVRTFAAVPGIDGLPAYVFKGLGQIKESSDPYIKWLDKNFDLSKMTAMQNQNLVPTHQSLGEIGVPAGAQ